VHVPWAKQQLKRLLRSIEAEIQARPMGLRAKGRKPKPPLSPSPPPSSGGGAGIGGGGGGGGLSDLKSLSPQLLVDLLYIMAELNHLPPGGTQSIGFKAITGRIQVRDGSRCGFKYTHLFFEV
jgi:hypothetical protein